MANYNTLKSAIEAVIKTNGNNEITGALMQQSLLAMITSLGAHYQFVDVATPSTNPGTPDQNVMYFAGTAGTYTNFGGIVVNEGEFCALCWNGSWIKKTTGAATAEQVSALGRKVGVYFPVWEYGNISNMSTNWTYSASTTRVRLQQGMSLYLYPGDKVGLTSYTGFRYYVGWRLNGSYQSWGWLTDDFYIQKEGEYTFLLCKDPEAALSSVEELSDLFFLETERENFALQEGIVKLNEQVFPRLTPTNDDWTTGSRLGGDGKITTGSSASNYSATYDYFFFRKGTKIKITSCASSGYPCACVYNMGRAFVETALSGTGTSNLASAEYTFAFDGYMRFTCYTSQRARFAAQIVSPAVLLDSVDLLIKGKADAIQSSVNFTTRGVYITTNLTLSTSNNVVMSDPFLVKKGQTVHFNAHGTSTPIFLLVGVDSPIPITSVSDVRKFTRIVDNYNASSSINTDSWFTATEDTYVIAQCYRPGDIAAFTLGYEPIVDRVADVDGAVRELEQYVDVPKPWVKAEEKLMLSKLRELSQTKLLVWAFNTDQHYGQNESSFDSNAAILRGLRSIGSIASQFPFDLVVLGGDEAGYGGGDDSTLQGISADVAEVLRGGFTPVCPVVAMAGNHDAYQNMGAENSDGYQEYNWKTRGNVARRELDWAGIRSTNCWYDDETNKVRYIFLDKYSKNQGTWPDSEIGVCIINALADNKLKNSDWQVIIFSHNVVASAGGNTSDPMADVVWDTISAAQIAGVDIVACINGHAHTIQQGVKDDVLMICVGQALPVMSGTTSIHASFDGNVYHNVLNSAKETSYAVFAYDRTNQKLYAFQYGAGTDRVFDTTPGSRGIELDALSGVVSSAGTIAGGTITATNHNTQYSVTLDATGAYSFPYLCPGLDWLIEVELPGGETASQTYSAEAGTHTLNITAS